MEFFDKVLIIVSVVKLVDQVYEDDLCVVEQNLFLVDFYFVDVNDVIICLLEMDKCFDSEILIGVFNVDDDDDLLCLVGLLMVNGGFQYDCFQGLLIKGIKLMFEGELWFLCKVLQQYLVKSCVFNKIFGCNEVNFIDCEIEVFKVMVIGVKNLEIVLVLNFSLYIIKIYIYNIFKKINVFNCLQVVNWVQENL